MFFFQKLIFRFGKIFSEKVKEKGKLEMKELGERGRKGGDGFWGGVGVRGI
jgi:hypothetical protein